MKDLKSWFCGWVYLEKMATEQLTRVKYKNREDLLQTNDWVSKEIGVPFLVTYHPHLNALNKIIRRNLKHLHSDQLVSSVFTPAPFISFRTSRNLRSLSFALNFIFWNELLVRISVILLVAKLKKILKIGMENFKINHCFDCNSK